MTVIDKKITKKQINALLKNLKPKKEGVNINKFAGKLSWKGNVLKTQRALRDDR